MFIKLNWLSQSLIETISICNSLGKFVSQKNLIFPTMLVVKTPRSTFKNVPFPLLNIV